MNNTDDTYLGYNFRNHTIIGSPESINSFIVMVAEKPDGQRQLIFKSRENLLSNETLVAGMVKYSTSMSAALKESLHLNRQLFPPSEGEPNLFIAEDLADGIPLIGELFDRTLPQDAAIRYIKQILDALGQFHSIGHVYGTVDPRFVFLVDRSGIKEAKLGALFHVHPENEHFPVGYTPELSAPDLGDDTIISDRTKDVYSVGMLAYRMLMTPESYKELFSNAVNATSPIDRDKAWQQYHREKYSPTTPFVALDSLDADIPPSISEVVGRMLNLAGDNRFDDALGAKRALEVAHDEAIRWRQHVRQTGTQGYSTNTRGRPGGIIAKKSISGGKLVKGFLVASFLASLCIGGVYYQFKYKPAKKAAELYAAKLNGAEQRFTVELKGLRDAKSKASEAAAALSTQHAISLAMADADKQYKELENLEVENSPEGFNSGSLKVVELIGRFREVSSSVEDLSEEASTAISDVNKKIGPITALSPADDSTLQAILDSLAQIKQNFQNKKFDVSIQDSKSVLDIIDKEILSRQAAKKNATDITTKSKETFTKLAALLPSGSQEELDAKNVVEGLDDQLSKNQFSFVSASGAEATEAWVVQIDKLNKKLGNLQSQLESQKQQLNSLQAQTSSLSDSQLFESPIEDVSKGLASLEDSIQARSFDAADELVSSNNQALANVTQKIGELSTGAENKIKLLRITLNRLTKLRPEQSVADVELAQSLEQATAALESGNSTLSISFAEAAYKTASTRLAELHASEAKVKALLIQAQSLLNDVIERGGDGFGDYVSVSRAYQNAGQLLNNKQFVLASDAFEDVIAKGLLLSENVAKTNTEFNRERSKLVEAISALGAKGASPKMTQPLEEMLTTADQLSNNRKLNEAIATQALTRTELTNVTQKFEQLVTDFQISIDNFSSLKNSYKSIVYRDEQILSDIENAISSARSLAEKNEYESATQRLLTDQEQILARLKASETISQNLANDLEKAKSQKELAISSRAQELAEFSKGEALLKLALEAVDNTDYLTATNQADQAGTLFSQASSKANETQQQLTQSALSSIQKTTDALQKAVLIQAIPQAYAVQIQEKVDAIDPKLAKQENLEELSELYSSLDKAILLVEKAKPKAESLKLISEEVYGKIEKLDGYEALDGWDTINAGRKSANEAMSSGAYIVAIASFEKINVSASEFLVVASRPARMGCDVENGLDGMRQVDGGDYSAERLMENNRFKKRFAAKVKLTNEPINIPTQFCIQTNAVSQKQFSLFVKEIDALNFPNLPSSLKEGTSPSVPVGGVTIELANQYAQWLSNVTSRTYRLPTASELLVADSLVIDDEQTFGVDQLIWTADSCTTFMGLVAKVPTNAFGAISQCRLKISSSNADVSIRLVLEPANN